jgi:hypothetical protein
MKLDKYMLPSETCQFLKKSKMQDNNTPLHFIRCYLWRITIYAFEIYGK